MYIFIFILFINTIFFNELDYGDLELNKNKKTSNKLLQEIEYENEIKKSLLNNTNILNKSSKKLKKILNTNDINSVVNVEMWKKIHDYIINNWNIMVIDGILKIDFHIKYSFCLFIFFQIPTEIIFTIPSFYHVLIPKNAYSLPVLKSFFIKLKQFDEIVRKKVKKPFF